MFKVNYLPNVQYAWASPFFTFRDEWNGAPGYSRFAQLVPGVPLNAHYPITVTSTFPDGSTESLTTQVLASAPLGAPVPTKIEIRSQMDFVHVFFIDDVPPCDCNNSNPNTYEWSLDGGATWHNFGFSYALTEYEATQQNITQICARTLGCNQTSATTCIDVPPFLGDDKRSKAFPSFSNGGVYPNPAQDGITFPWPKDGSKTCQTLLFDVAGKARRSDAYVENASINIASLADGIYRLMVISEKGQIETYTFHKSNAR